jgi:hypothetical protein
MILDLSGYMFSGKASVSDILSEFDNIYVPNNREEFDLLRVGGGLIDLKNAIDDWSPIRTNSAIKRFQKTISRLSRHVKFANSFLNIGWAYNNRYPNIEAHTKLFISDITQIEWETPWPYDLLEIESTQIFKTRIEDFKKTKWSAIKFLVKIIDYVYKKIILENSFDYNQSQEFKYKLSVNVEQFTIAAQKYISNILWEEVDENIYKILVTHNALEPFNPARNLDLLGPNSKSIVVNRDPRDIYVTALTHQVGFNDNVELYKKIIGATDLNTFINRYKTYQNNIINNKNVLRLEFSEIVYNYENTIDRICDFINIDKIHHINRQKAFNPSVSEKNINMWKNPEYNFLKNEFKKIEIDCC